MVPPLFAILLVAFKHSESPLVSISVHAILVTVMKEYVGDIVVEVLPDPNHAKSLVKSGVKMDKLGSNGEAGFPIGMNCAT